MGCTASVLDEPGLLPKASIHRTPILQLFWDLDNIELPANLDAALQRLRNLHVTALGWPEESSLKYELTIVCNVVTNGRIQDRDRSTLQRAGFAPKVVTSTKEAADRDIERSIEKIVRVSLHRARTPMLCCDRCEPHKHAVRTVLQEYMEDTGQGLVYEAAIGVISNDEDYACKLRIAKEKGISTFYVSSSKALRAKENVKAATTAVVDWNADIAFTGPSASQAPHDPPGPLHESPASPANADSAPLISTSSPQQRGLVCPKCSQTFKLPKSFKGDKATAHCPSCFKAGMVSPVSAAATASASPLESASFKLSSGAKDDSLVTCSVEGCNAKFTLRNGFKGKNPKCAVHRPPPRSK